MTQLLNIILGQRQMKDSLKDWMMGMMWSWKRVMFSWWVQPVQVWAFTYYTTENCIYIVFPFLTSSQVTIWLLCYQIGKTLLAKTLARFVNVPFVIADATTLTQASMYVFVHEVESWAGSCQMIICDFFCLICEFFRVIEL